MFENDITFWYSCFWLLWHFIVKFDKGVGNLCKLAARGKRERKREQFCFENWPRDDSQIPLYFSQLDTETEIIFSLHSYITPYHPKTQSRNTSSFAVSFLFSNQILYIVRAMKKWVRVFHLFFFLYTKRLWWLKWYCLPPIRYVK